MSAPIICVALPEKNENPLDVTDFIVNVSDLPNIILSVLRCGVRSMTSVSLVIRNVLSETDESSFKNFIVSVSELPNISLCVLRHGVRSTASVSLVIKKVLS